ncbi:protein C8orf37 homolog isoform X1 [Amblyraja radiata]|uniref:protein C8orf37 homolog isoform X1 n=1 Tax=Amblyraja radiata TaxID=386614 RepID=UPI001402C0AE|nr:protein C8orf37 homolog isoform X1 [Amblyraja radiata]XP_032875960.1 protein C8orf37 homolog isoform X1 [Amblyraja radiata]XP_032875961.1 protein C8orf37 homolog isoform X1 [Amblyraja radiata]
MAAMTDDLDQLLDEVEMRFCRSGPAAGGSLEGAEGAAGAGGSDKEVKTRSPTVPSVDDEEEDDEEGEDLNDLIKDIFQDDPTVLDLSKSSGRAVTNCAAHQANGRKCSPVYLGGSSAPHGLGTNTSHRTCDQLRCTTCDFRVIAIDDCEWNKSCDYLFFRNSMPDVSKLEVKALSKKGARAYACQCSWRSVHTLTDIREEQHLRWVCGKH